VHRESDTAYLPRSGAVSGAARPEREVGRGCKRPDCPSALVPAASRWHWAGFDANVFDPRWRCAPRIDERLGEGGSSGRWQAPLLSACDAVSQCVKLDVQNTWPYPF
jgi:hypothetical protein